jgi:hypothetical protein
MLSVFFVFDPLYQRHSDLQHYNNLCNAWQMTTGRRQVGTKVSALRLSGFGDVYFRTARATKTFMEASIMSSTASLDPQS